MRSRALALLLFATVASTALASPRARADGDTSRRARLVYLRGLGTEGCPLEAELRDAVSARLGYDPFSTWATDTLFVELAPDAQGGFVARVKLVDAQSVVRGERELHARNACADLVPTMALTVSLALDPMASTRNGALPEDTPPREKPVDLDAGAPPEPPKRDEPQPPAQPQPAVEASRLGLALGGGLLGGVGSAPAPSLGLSLFAEGRYAWASLALEGRVDLPSTADVDRALVVSGAPKVSSWLYAGELRACGHLRGAFACGVGLLGELKATAVDVSSPSGAGGLWAAAGLRAGYDYALAERTLLRGQVEGDAVFTRYALTLDGREVYRYAPFAANLGLSILFRLE